MPKHTNDFEDPTGVGQMWDDDEVNEEIANKQSKQKQKQKTRVVIKKKINKKNPYKYLNNLSFTKESIDLIKHYLKTDELPPDLNERQQKTFITNYSTNWILDKNNNLIFTPLDLIAVEESEIEPLLQKIYDDPVKSLGKGIQSLYDTVKSELVGITRQNVKDFLNKQEVYQMTFVKKKAVQKPIYARFSNEKWSCDLIDMNQYTSSNEGYRYILTVIDYFSRKVFAEKIKNKDAESVENAFNKIVAEQAGNITPQVLISDGGGEFNLDDWCKQRRIKHIITESHSPTQNSLVENFNGSLRRLIRANYVKNNNLNWINDLQIFVNNYNSRKHKTTGYVPNDIWSNQKVKVRFVEETDELQQTREQKICSLSTKTLAKVTKQIAKLQQQTLAVGDSVRVSTKSLNSEVRKAIKAGNSKLVVVKFSAKVFKVAEITKSRTKKDFALDKYILKDLRGKILLEEFNLKTPNKVLKPKKFNITELLLIDPKTKNTRTKADEEKLNKIINKSFEEVVPIEQPRKSERIKKLTTLEKAKITREQNKVEKEPERRSSRTSKPNSKLNL